MAQLSRSKDIKYLGVTIDESLCYKKYVNILIGKLNRALGILRRVSKYVDQITRVTLYNTLVLPHLDYCSTIWGISIGKGDLQRLQRIQNAAMRIILQCHHRTHIRDMLNCLKWLSVEQRLRHNLCYQMWKIIHKEALAYLDNIFEECGDIHNYNTRASTSKNIYNTRCHKLSLKALSDSEWYKSLE